MRCCTKCHITSPRLGYVTMINSFLFRPCPKCDFSIGEAVEFESLYLSLNESILQGAVKMKYFVFYFPAL